jgi:GrpB-like predicted nucleotidyltransferase (UPF0157 family)
MHVQVDEYNPQWPKQFQQIKTDLEHVLEGVPYISIEHVGSTSVPGLAAKPVIDIDIIITQDHLQDAIDAFTKEGLYVYRGDLGIPHRYAFKHKDANILPKRNVYVCIDGCQSLRNHLAVRDLCRKDVEVREKYGQAKLELSKREWESVDEYAEAKTEVLNWVLSKAGFDIGELDEIADMNKV